MLSLASKKLTQVLQDKDTDGSQKELSVQHQLSQYGIRF